MGADETGAEGATDEIDRATRLARNRGSWKRRAAVTSIAVVVVVAAGAGTYAAVASSQKASGAPQTSASVVTDPPTTARPTTTAKTVPPTTMPAIPPVVQPPDQSLPNPGNGIGYGARGPAVLAYEARMKALHFDPGPVDGVFDQDTQYAVITVQKYFGLPRTGVIDARTDIVLTHFLCTPAEATRA